jgi:hypothetical protein
MPIGLLIDGVMTLGYYITKGSYDLTMRLLYGKQKSEEEKQLEKLLQEQNLTRIEIKELQKQIAQLKELEEGK